MLYLERSPHPALAPYIKTFRYAFDPGATHRHERILPNGHPQIVISLARDYLTDANHPTHPPTPSSTPPPPSSSASTPTTSRSTPSTSANSSASSSTPAAPHPSSPKTPSSS